MTTCGCGRIGTYEVEGQAHCTPCMLEATDCTVPVLVRKIDVWEAIKHEQAGQTLTA